MLAEINAIKKDIDTFNYNCKSQKEFDEIIERSREIIESRSTR